MGRKIFFRFDDFPQFSAELKKFSWEDLYGKRSVDLRSFDGSSLIPVSVTFDGEHILPLSSTSLQYLDSSGFCFSSSLVSTLLHF